MDAVCKTHGYKVQSLILDMKSSGVGPDVSKYSKYIIKNKFSFKTHHFGIRLKFWKKKNFFG